MMGFNALIGRQEPVLPPKLVGASVPPTLAASSIALAADTLYVMRVDATPGVAFGGVSTMVATAGATLTAGRSFASVYHPDGTLMGKTRDQSAVWTSAGAHEHGLVAEPGVELRVPAQGYVYVTLQSAGTTRPAFARASVSTAATLPAGSDSRSGITMATSVSSAITSPPARLPRLSLQPPGNSGTPYVGLLGSAVNAIHRPIPGGTSSGNLQVKDNKVFIRFAARETGYLEEFAVATRAEVGADASYVGGTFGTFRARFFPVGIDGLPDMSGSPLGTTETFNPNTRQNADSTTYGTANNNLVVLQAGFHTVEGQLYCLVVDNTDPAPAVNYASLNFIYSTDGLVGAQSRNELDPAAADAYYGVDPREGVGQIWGDGSVHYPSSSVFDASVKKHVPVFVQGYPLGRRYGQPYFSKSDIAAGAVSATYKIPALILVDEIGAFHSASDSYVASLLINGAVWDTATLSGLGHVSGAIDPVVLAPSDVVKVQGTTTQAGALQSTYAGAAMKTYWLQRSNRPFSSSGTTNLDDVYDSDLTRSVPLYPIGVPLVR